MNTQLSKITTQTMSSLEIAKLTGKDHDKVLVDIRTMLDELEIGHAVFRGSYLSKQNKSLSCFNLPRRECDILISGYSLKYRAAIVDRWHELELKEQGKIDSQKLRAELRGDYHPMTDAIIESRDGKETKFFHFSNEADMLNRIVLGCTASKFRKANDVEDKESVRDYFSPEQKKAMIALQKANTVYLMDDLSFEERKEKLESLFRRRYRQLMIEEVHRLSA